MGESGSSDASRAAKVADADAGAAHNRPDCKRRRKGLTLAVAKTPIRFIVPSGTHFH